MCKDPMNIFQGIDSVRLHRPEEESIPGLLKRFANLGAWHKRVLLRIWTYRRVTRLQPARWAAVLGQPSSLQPHCPILHLPSDDNTHSRILIIWRSYPSSLSLSVASVLSWVIIYVLEDFLS